MINQIKWACQRITRGYDDRVYWGFDSYFLQVMPALRNFCEAELKWEHITLNPKRKRVFERTIKLIDEHGNSKNIHSTKSKLLKYVGEHAGYYWN